jgi:hypothetical protein
MFALHEPILPSAKISNTWRTERRPLSIHKGVRDVPAVCIGMNEAFGLERFAKVLARYRAHALRLDFDQRRLFVVRGDLWLTLAMRSTACFVIIKLSAPEIKVPALNALSGMIISSSSANDLSKLIKRQAVSVSPPFVCRMTEIFLVGPMPSIMSTNGFTQSWAI